MKQIGILVVILLALTSVASAETFGKGITVQEITLISDILANPEQYVGNRVKVEGVIVEVCAKRGCWIYLAGDKPFEKIRVKVTDGEIVFPMEARGRVGTVEGVVERLEMNREEMIAKKRHHAEEKGEVFDPTAIVQGGVIYRIRGLGAEIPGL